MPCWSACYVTPRRAVLPSSPMGVRAISIFFQFIQFLGAAATADDGEVGAISISSFHLFADSAKHPAGRLRSPLSAYLPSSFAPPPPPGSRCGRPVLAGPIGKQSPKIYFPVSFPSSTSKHSRMRWKKGRRRNFCLLQLFRHFAFRPPPRKFDKSQNL